MGVSRGEVRHAVSVLADAAGLGESVSAELGNSADTIHFVLWGTSINPVFGASGISENVAK